VVEENAPDAIVDLDEADAFADERLTQKYQASLPLDDAPASDRSRLEMAGVFDDRVRAWVWLSTRFQNFGDVSGGFGEGEA
jgi:hypothetical protein